MSETKQMLAVAPQRPSRTLLTLKDKFSYTITTKMSQVTCMIYQNKASGQLILLLSCKHQTSTDDRYQGLNYVKNYKIKTFKVVLFIVVTFKLDKKHIFNIKTTKWNSLKFVECVYCCFSNKSLQALTFRVKLESMFLVLGAVLHKLQS